LYRCMASVIWSGRNEMLHDKQDEHKSEVIKHIVEAEICRFHNKPDLLMLKDDIHYREQSLKRLLQSSASRKRRWLHHVKLSCNKKAAMLSQQPRITKFFHKEPKIEKHCLNKPTAIFQDTYLSKQYYPAAPHTFFSRTRAKPNTEHESTPTRSLATT
jgi:hypothetical protein